MIISETVYLRRCGEREPYARAIMSDQLRAEGAGRPRLSFLFEGFSVGLFEVNVPCSPIGLIISCLNTGRRDKSLLNMLTQELLTFHQSAFGPREQRGKTRREKQIY